MIDVPVHSLVLPLLLLRTLDHLHSFKLLSLLFGFLFSLFLCCLILVILNVCLGVPARSIDPLELSFKFMHSQGLQNDIRSI